MNKKYYNFKTKHKRKKRTRAAQIWWKSGSGTGDYTKMKRRLYRTRSKRVLNQIKNGKENPFPLYKRTLKWEY